MYTWGYIKSVSLAKLDLTEEEAENQGLIANFPYYANEVITQVCSAIKPKNTFAEFIVVDRKYLELNYGPINNNEYEKVAKEHGLTLIGTVACMPSDFTAFGDDVNERVYSEYNAIFVESATDEDFRYLGYNKVLFRKPGTYQISYKARWIDFVNITSDDGTRFGTMSDSYELDVPADILDCIPNYIASQCFKIDDMEKSQIFRNEYEMSLARIDDTDYKNSKTFSIGGDW